MADGFLRISTRLDNSKLNSDANELKKTIDANVKSIERQITASEKNIERFNSKINDTNSELAEVYAKMDLIANEKSEFAIKGVSVEELLESDSEYQKLIQKASQLEKEATSYNAKIQESHKKQEMLNLSLDEAKNKQKAVNKEISETKERIRRNAELNESMNASIKKGVGNILKYAAALLSIRGIYGILKSSMSAWLNSNSQRSKTIKSRYRLHEICNRKCVVSSVKLDS